MVGDIPLKDGVPQLEADGTLLVHGGRRSVHDGPRCLADGTPREGGGTQLEDVSPRWHFYV